MAASVAWAVAISALSVTDVHAVVGGQATIVSITSLGKSPEDYHLSCKVKADVSPVLFSLFQLGMVVTILTPPANAQTGHNCDVVASERP